MDHDRFRRRLLRWYRRHRRPLPWRQAADPYRIWVSEVMLQQTQVATALPYYQRFLERFPSLDHLAGAELAEVLKAWEGLGYYGRARNLHRAARQVADEHQGRLPEARPRLRALPGVGDYIANAVLSMAFQQPLAVVDGNVLRVLARLMRLKAPVNLPASRPLYQEQADRLLDPACPGDFNQALMELGALVCTPRRPACAQCPVSDDCQAFQCAATGAFPVRAPRAPAPHATMVTAVIRRRKRLLVARRQAAGLLGGLWEFPGAALLPDEDPLAAGERIAKAVTGLNVVGLSRLGRVHHAYSHLRVTHEVLLGASPRGAVRLAGPEAFRWVRPGEMAELAFPRVQQKIFALLKAQIQNP
jgi:A/G-specific adenine glycosylase